MPRVEYGRFRPDEMAAMETPPVRGARLVTWLVVVFFALALAWGIQARTDIVVSARGEIVPAGHVKQVQAAVRGVIHAIHVRDGQAVSRGDVLLELDGTSTTAERQSLSASVLRLRLAEQRLRAELGEKLVIGEGIDAPIELVEMARTRHQANQRAFAERVARHAAHVDAASAALAVAERQADGLALRIEQARRTRDDRRVQVERGLVPRQQLVDAGYALASLVEEAKVLRERIRAEEIALAAAREALNEARSSHRSDLLGQLSAAGDERARLEQALVVADDRLGRQTLRAPVDGTVQELAVTTVGGVLEVGDPVAVIVPANAGVELLVRIRNQDIGFVTPQQPVRVKVDAFEFTRYGTIDGALDWVGADAIVDRHEGPVYPARIALAETRLGNRVGERQARVSAGMQATADIVIGQRRLIEFALAPILRYRDESLRER